LLMGATITTAIRRRFDSRGAWAVSLRYAA
jgi:hypothetical protein